jgi:hypothetical protein
MKFKIGAKKKSQSCVSLKGMGTGEEEQAQTSGCAGCTNLIVTTGVWKDAYHNPKPPFPFMARTIRGEGGFRGQIYLKLKL